MHRLESLGFCALLAADAQDAAGPFLPLDRGGEEKGAAAFAGDRAREDDGRRKKTDNAYIYIYIYALSLYSKS